MTDKLVERLKELSTVLENQHVMDNAEETMGHLQAEIEDAMTRSRAKAQQCTILLFQSSDPPSLLQFLATSADFVDEARKRDVAHTRANVLELLATFLERVKAQALTVVINVLRFCEKQVSNEEIEPGEYVDKLFYDIKFSKATQTAKGQMLEVIGYLVQKFPEDVKGLVPLLLSWIEGELQKQFASNSPEMLLVNGLLFALARLLEREPERYKHDEGMRKKVYS
ncbi:hypothetical protein BBO99_00000025 [Phytophthora kernoviae]|uniref:Uncharacterized protein n=2 Tax=Phytophthora kernoviae TaxID=325452 RepID=A0A3R7JWS4_9STRA|nr:hypothetical protein G195_003399 [Phytophthora kernoviae 00238/432]KAG2533081.1 hypothetical protein JM16_000209 [Phytophthora kernoviae]KAG2533340.1 hypothetical protein JM18_000144 [Phytophthora kernoviae]RLN26891.1 hypothetical protein BBI17_000025 [Phytophthora kernoviae]RLN85960.1 hypothetical protein BBO99_00000025 [Phytophthora kernoviae]